MINVAEHELKTILGLLDKHVPECEVRAFGSRVTWTAKEHSDLDLVVVGPTKLERGRIENLKEAFEESSLPFTVDVMDWHKISAEFQKNIEKSFTVLKKPVSGNKAGWKYYKVSDFAEVIGGGTPKTEVTEYWNGNIPWITPKDLSSHQARRISRGERNITQEGLKNSSARIVPANTVLLTSRAPVGYLAIAQNEVATNQGFRNLVVNEGFSPEFVYYLLLNNVDYLKKHASGSTFQELSGGTLKNLEFQIPEYATQKQIAKILGDLDEKIEINYQMNKTLESIAQAIFKKWFVDFEFPGYEKTKLVNGLPEGWREEPIGNLVDSVSITHQFPRDKIIFLNTSDISNGQVLCHDYCDVSGLPGQAKKSIKRDDILFSEIRPENRRFAYIDFDANDYVVSTKLMVLRAKSKVHPLVIFNFLKMDDCINELQMLAESRSGTFPQITFDNLRKIALIVPDDFILNMYTEFLKANFAMLQQNYREAQHLISIRDALLPKLMTGEVAV